MKVTLFTSNDIRHNYLIETISKSCERLFVVQESFLNSKQSLPKISFNSNIMKNYFEKVYEAQVKIFDCERLDNLPANVKLINFQEDELNSASLNSLSEFLKSDLYVVFGSSYLKGPLVDFLITKHAINIHMGVSPFYRGSDCNFWALYDNNPHLVGATIHLLTKGLDSGPILYHAMSNIKDNPFIYTMSAVKSAFLSLRERIKNKSIFQLNSIVQDKSKQIRYSKKTDFNDVIVNKYFLKKINLNYKKFDYRLLKEPFFLNE